MRTGWELLAGVALGIVAWGLVQGLRPGVRARHPGCSRLQVVVLETTRLVSMVVGFVACYVLAMMAMGSTFAGRLDPATPDHRLVSAAVFLFLVVPYALAGGWLADDLWRQKIRGWLSPSAPQRPTP